MPRNIAPIDSLSPSEIRVTGHAALGLTSGEIALKLRLAKGTVDGQLRHAQHKMGVTNRACLIHLCYTRMQLPRPARTESPERLDDAEVEIIRLIAEGATYPAIAQHNTHELSQHGVKVRIKALREKWQAKNDPHLITRAWEFGVLTEP
ncbi:LuxR C-terminal-related transcriptional regulator [Streptomyces sp. RGM 3693]|uniref:LuxR C-terminal-related transcriptional regulator n=1 Tax=Streptomyces sp. RGM 3693 TaxID=3413284 RepID=UPI003D28ED9F